MGQGEGRKQGREDAGKRGTLLVKDTVARDEEGEGRKQGRGEQGYIVSEAGKGIYQQEGEGMYEQRERVRKWFILRGWG